MQSGHVVLGQCGNLVSIDNGFARIMRAEMNTLIGRPVLDITAVADREECGEAIATLRATRRPFELSKRFVRDDGSLVWVTNTVSMVGNGRDTDLIVATISPILNAGAPRKPAMLLDSARMLADLHDARAEAFDRSLLSDTAWHAILAAYVAEAEGRAITVCALAAKLAISQRQAHRWITALVNQGIVEIETRETDPAAPKGFRLSGDAHARLEDHLARACDVVTRRGASGRRLDPAFRA